MREHMKLEETTFSQTTCNRRGIIIGVIAVVVFFALGVIIGWFSRTPGAAMPPEATPAPPGPTQPLVPPSSSPGTNMSFDAIDFIINNLDKDRMRDNLREYTNETRLPGTELDDQLSQRILDQWSASGIDQAHFASYDVLLSFPNKTSPNKVQIVNSNGEAEFTSAPREKPLTEAENRSEIVPPFNAFAPAGVAVGELVYVNYGRVEDFQFLTQNLSMDLTGKILIARYGKIFRGDKLQLAATYSAAGMILYNDPSDFNSDPTAEPYPHSWWLPPSGLQRGTVGADGDYQTPLYPSTDYAYRIPINEVKDLPKVPCQPIGYGDAEVLLRQLGGDPAPPDWQGRLNLTYRLGPGFSNSSLKARVEVNNYLRVHTAHNVIGYVRGAVEPDRYVLMGNHHDAWAFGAIDPLSGSAALTDIVRVFGQMLQQGYRPRRTIVFCSWDAEEPGLLGSTEFVEDKMKVLYERAVAYLNVDYSVDFPYTIQAGTSPLLQDQLYASAKKVPSPEKDGKSLYELWRTRPTSSSSPPPNEPNVYYSLGSGSDMATFYQRAGVPAIDMWFSYDEDTYDILSYPVYHSAYETFYTYTNFIDPYFNYTLAMAQFWAVMASDLANAELLNMDVRRYSNSIKTFRDSLLDQFRDKWQEQGIDIDSFTSAVQNFSAAADDFDRVLKSKNATTMSPLELRMLNDRMIQLERAFIDPEGLPGRPQYKHVVFAPSRFDAYSDNSFPGIVDTMYDLQNNKTSDWSLLKHQVYVATYMVQSAANTLNGVGL